MDRITVQRPLAAELRQQNYTIFQGKEISVTPELQADGDRLWGEWSDLEPDPYLKNGARFRNRRFGLFYFVPETGETTAYPASTYFQASSINSYAGGIKRRFAPLSDDTLNNEFLQELIRFDFRQSPVEDRKKSDPWEVDIHQIRIIASADEIGQPTPEGVHQDAQDFVCIHLVERRNVVGGVNTVHDLERREIASCTLEDKMDSVILCDPYVMHGVSPIQPEDPTQVAWRDTLLIGYEHKPGLERP
jgi:hypothetical protein